MKWLPIFDQSTTKWSDKPDLIRKNYLFDFEKRIAGGVYLWKEKMHAEIWLGDEFRKMVKVNYCDGPSLQFFETPIVVGNFTGNITKERDLFIYKQIINILEV